MNLLVTGKGTSGAWQVRGAQLGAAIGAAVVPNHPDPGYYDLTVLVKRPTEALLQRLHITKARIVWDLVDPWPQPPGNEWSRSRCLHWLEESVRMIMPAGIVAATHAMADDCKRFGLPVLALPHHARPGQQRNPIRPAVKVVGYEGGEGYIARWRKVIEAECKDRGWSFVVNPPELAQVDIVLALRDCNGYAPWNWKSGVKLANAQGSGTPVICSREAGCIDVSCGWEQWADNPQELAKAFDALTPTAARLDAATRLLMAAPSLDSVAATYKQWLVSKF